MSCTIKGCKHETPPPGSARCKGDLRRGLPYAWGGDYSDEPVYFENFKLIDEAALKELTVHPYISAPWEVMPDCIDSLIADLTAVSERLKKSRARRMERLAAEAGK